MKKLYIGEIEVVYHGRTTWEKHIEIILKNQISNIYHSESKNIHHRVEVREYNITLFNRKNAETIPNIGFMSDGVYCDYRKEVAFKYSSGNLTLWLGGRTSVSFPALFQEFYRITGKYFLHGAGIVNGDRSIILTGSGGIGKTSFIASAMKRKGVKLLGDDLIILDEHGYSYPYLRPFCMYPYHKKLFNDLFMRVRPKYMSNHPLIKRLQSRANRYFNSRLYNSFYPASPSDIYPKDQLCTSSSKISDIYFVRRVIGIEEVSVTKKTNPDNLALKCASIMDYEFREVQRILLPYRILTGINNHEQEVERNRVFRSAFTKSQVHLVSVPYDMGAAATSEMLDKVILGTI